MAIFNLKNREIDCKIVYYGPGRSGKTSNLEHLHSRFKNQVAGEMVSINTEGDRTLFFDFLPMDIGKIHGCNVRVHLYTVPGQVQYRATRKLVLNGVDGVVFVADSLQVRRAKNMQSLKDLQQNLKEYNLSIFKTPLVLQYNKRDLVDSGISMLSVAQLQEDLNDKLNVPYYPASATKGDGVARTLHACMKLTLAKLQKELSF